VSIFTGTCRRATLCDEIRCSAWTAGPSSNSVKPDCVRLRPSTYTPITAEDKWVHDFKKVGNMTAAEDPTLDDLAEIAEGLCESYQDFSDYVREVGLIEA